MKFSASEKAFQLFMAIPDRGKSEISPRQIQKSYSSHRQPKEYIPPKDTFFPGPGIYELRNYIDRYKKNESIENLRRNNRIIMNHDILTKRSSVPNNPPTQVLLESPKDTELNDSFSSKMLETDNHFKREMIPRRTDDAVRVFNSNTYKTLKPTSKNLNLKVEVRPESRSRQQNQSPMKIDILSKDLFNQSHTHTRAPSRASSQEFSPSVEKKFERFVVKNKSLNPYNVNSTPQRKRKKSIDKSLAVLSSEMLGKLSQRYNANQTRPKNIIIKNLNPHTDYFRSYATCSPEKRRLRI